MSIARFCAIVVLVSVSMSAAAAAAESGPYVSASIGQANHAENVALRPPGVDLMTGRSEGEDTGWSFGVGYRFSRHLALELGYLDLGEMKASVGDETGASDARADFTFSIEGVTFAMIGTFPIGSWEPYLKAGVLFSDSELVYSGRVSGDAFAATVKDDSQDPFFGGGIGYAIGERWVARLDLTYVAEAGDRDSGESNYMNVFLGAEWRF